MRVDAAKGRWSPYCDLTTAHVSRTLSLLSNVEGSESPELMCEVESKNLIEFHWVSGPNELSSYERQCTSQSLHFNDPELNAATNLDISHHQSHRDRVTRW